MTIVRKDGSSYEVTDYTEEVLSVPNQFGLLNDLGIFNERGISQNTFQMEFRDETLGLIEDQPRGKREQTNGSNKSELKAWPIPHFPFDDSIMPQDIQGKRRHGTANDVETQAGVRADKTIRMRRSWSETLERARWDALYGSVYAPNGSVNINWYQDIVGSGTGPEAINVNMTETTSADINQRLQELEDTIQDNTRTSRMTGQIVVACSSGWWDSFINHSSVREAYLHFASTQGADGSPLRGMDGDRMYRRFDYGNMTFIRHRGTDAAGNAYVTANEAIAIPVAEDLYETIYGPANKFSYVNTVGESQYMFEYDDGRDTEIILESESNFLNIVKKPAAIRRLTRTV